MDDLERYERAHAFDTPEPDWSAYRQKREFEEQRRYEETLEDMEVRDAAAAD